MKKLLALSALPFLVGLFLSGCGQTPEGSMFRAAIQERGAQIMDEGIDNVTWWLCNGASVGSIKRKFSGEKAQAYTDLCNETGQVPGLSTE